MTRTKQEEERQGWFGMRLTLEDEELLSSLGATYELPPARAVLVRLALRALLETRGAGGRGRGRGGRVT